MVEARTSNPDIFFFFSFSTMFYYSRYCCVFYYSRYRCVFLIIAMYFITTWHRVEINIRPVVWTLSFTVELLSSHPVSA